MQPHLQVSAKFIFSHTYIFIHNLYNLYIYILFIHFIKYIKLYVYLFIYVCTYIFPQKYSHRMKLGILSISSMLSGLSSHRALGSDMS